MSWPGWGLNPLFSDYCSDALNHRATKTPNLNHHIQLRYYLTADGVAAAWLFSCSDPKLGMAVCVRYLRNAFSRLPEERLFRDQIPLASHARKESKDSGESEDKAGKMKLWKRITVWNRLSLGEHSIALQFYFYVESTEKTMVICVGTHQIPVYSILITVLNS